MLPVVVTDDREKHPMHHLDGTACTYRTARLSVGDYALESMCRSVPNRKTLIPSFSVERKAPRDWISSWHGKYRDGKDSRGRDKWHINRRDEIDKIIKAQKLGFVMPYVPDGRECDLHAVILREPWRRIGLKWSEVIGNIKRLTERGLPVIFSANRRDAELNIFELLNAARKKETGAK